VNCGHKAASQIGTARYGTAVVPTNRAASVIIRNDMPLFAMRTGAIIIVNIIDNIMPRWLNVRGLKVMT
jgi:hypothetical protein